MKGATPTQSLGQNDPMISIHAPNERSDLYMSDTPEAAVISIHAPNERSDSSTKAFESYF